MGTSGLLLYRKPLPASHAVPLPAPPLRASVEEMEAWLAEYRKGMPAVNEMGETSKGTAALTADASASALQGASAAGAGGLQVAPVCAITAASCGLPPQKVYSAYMHETLRLLHRGSNYVVIADFGGDKFAEAVAAPTSAAQTVPAAELPRRLWLTGDLAERPGVIGMGRCLRYEPGGDLVHWAVAINQPLPADTAGAGAACNSSEQSGVDRNGPAPCCCSITSSADRIYSACEAT